MLPIIIEKTQPITGATSTTSSKPGLIPYIPAGADGYLHTSGEFKSIANNGEINYVRKLGEIFIYAGTDIPDNSLPFDGQIISECDVVYPDFYTWVINNGKTITLEEYETTVSQYSQCGYFGLDTTTKTVRLSKIKAFIQNAESVSEIGEAENAGLPNITGNWFGWNIMSIEGGNVSGAFQSNWSANGVVATEMHNAGVWDNLNVDASRSNSIYGNSTTVTPDNVKYRYFIYIKNEFTEIAKITTRAIMPVSDKTKYTTYTVTPINGSLDNFHTAPTDGYVRVIIDPADASISSGVILATYTSSTTNEDITSMANGTSMIEKEILCQTGTVNAIRHRLSVPIEKGNKFMLWMNSPNDIQVLDYSFIPCNGA